MCKSMQHIRPIRSFLTLHSLDQSQLYSVIVRLPSYITALKMSRTKVPFWRTIISFTQTRTHTHNHVHLAPTEVQVRRSALLIWRFANLSEQTVSLSPLRWHSNSLSSPFGVERGWWGFSWCECVCSWKCVRKEKKKKEVFVQDGGRERAMICQSGGEEEIEEAKVFGVTLRLSVWKETCVFLLPSVRVCLWVFVKYACSYQRGGAWVRESEAAWRAKIVFMFECVFVCACSWGNCGVPGSPVFTDRKCLSKAKGKEPCRPAWQTLWE